MQKNATKLLIELNNGNNEAYNELFSLVYDELREIAGKKLEYERRDPSLSRTELVHEVFIKLIDKDQIDWKNRAHFLGVASICMKQLLVDFARKKLADKRGGNAKKQTYIDQLVPARQHAKTVIDLNDALESLEKLDSRMSKIVEYRFFGGMTIEDTAEILNISKNTVKRDWAKARGLLYKELQKEIE